MLPSAIVAGLWIMLSSTPQWAYAQEPASEYVVIAWNDLGMHCMNGDFEGMTILPPFNTVQAQVIKRGNPPELVQSGVRISYRFPDNTDSASKVNFWTYAEDLFGVALEPNVGLTGNGLTGELEWNGKVWEVTGIPITPFSDTDPTTEDPYQLGELTVKEENTEQVLDKTTIVIPVSTEMHCDTCHPEDDDRANNIKDWTAEHLTDKTASWTSALAKVDQVADRQVDPKVVWQAILTKHDEEENTSLINNTPVLCASCHASNALGTPGEPGVPNLSLALHRKHAEEVGSSMDCYACHPGDQTQCHRGAMYAAGETCQDCHGNISQVAQSIQDGRRPWLDEPTCASCHTGYEENPDTLYRNSIGHGGIYCAACHGSPHAILPSTQPRDNLQAIRLQGHAGFLSDCMVCHTEMPSEPGPHGFTLADLRSNEWFIR